MSRNWRNCAGSLANSTQARTNTGSACSLALPCTPVDSGPSATEALPQETAAARDARYRLDKLCSSTAVRGSLLSSRRGPMTTWTTFWHGRLPPVVTTVAPAAGSPRCWCCCSHPSHSRTILPDTSASLIARPVPPASFRRLLDPTTTTSASISCKPPGWMCSVGPPGTGCSSSIAVVSEWGFRVGESGGEEQFCPRRGVFFFFFFHPTRKRINYR